MIPVMLRDVSVCFGAERVLEDINLSIGNHEFVAIIGPNGGGKTTLLNVILGLVKTSGGIVRVFGKSPEEGRKFVGYLPQRPSFDLSFPISVYEVVLMGRYRRWSLRKYTEEDMKAVENALHTVGMIDFKEKSIGILSGGQIQRVLIARALVRSPKLLLLDEPTASIDSEMQVFLYELLRKLREKMTVVIVTHDIGVVSDYVDRIVCLNRRIHYCGPPDLSEIARTYGHPVKLIDHGAHASVK